MLSQRLPTENLTGFKTRRGRRIDFQVSFATHNLKLTFEALCAELIATLLTNDGLPKAVDDDTLMTTKREGSFDQLERGLRGGIARPRIGLNLYGLGCRREPGEEAEKAQKNRSVNFEAFSRLHSNSIFGQFRKSLSPIFRSY